MTDTNKSGYAGQQSLTSSTSPFNSQAFLIDQILGLVRTATLVQVQSCTNDGGLSPVGLVDVLPLVNLSDGQGNSSKHGTLHSLTYCRLQGGSNAVIIDPKVGDIGVAVFSDRDLSSVKAAKAQANPGSWRRFDMADGMYLFGCLNAAPTQYIQFTDTGINITDVNANTIVMNADGITINGVVFDRSQNVSAIAKLTSTDKTSLGGGAQAVKLADGSNATNVTAT